mgnify:CR=1 FL=1
MMLFRRKGLESVLDEIKGHAHTFTVKRLLDKGISVPEKDIERAIEQGSPIQAAKILDKLGRDEESIRFYEQAGEYHTAGIRSEELGHVEEARRLYTTEIKEKEYQKDINFLFDLGDIVEKNSRLFNEVMVDTLEEQGDFCEAYAYARKAGFENRLEPIAQAGLEHYKSIKDSYKAGRFAEIQGKVEESIELYSDCHLSDAIRVAKEHKMTDAVVSLYLRNKDFKSATNMLAKEGKLNAALSICDRLDMDWFAAELAENYGSQDEAKRRYASIVQLDCDERDTPEMAEYAEKAGMKEAKELHRRAAIYFANRTSFDLAAEHMEKAGDRRKASDYMRLYEMLKS